jgi:hypothetical protein
MPLNDTFVDLDLLARLDLVRGREGRDRVGPALSMSHVAARQEVRALLQAIGIEPLA